MSEYPYLFVELPVAANLNLNFTFLFTNKFNELYYPQAPNDWLYNILEKYDLPKITLHGFRHTQASLLFESGASIKEVQGRFGHKDVKTTMNIYTHVTPEKVRETGEQFAKYVNFYQMAFTLKPRNKKRAQNIVNSMFWYSLNLLPH